MHYQPLLYIIVKNGYRYVKNVVNLPKNIFFSIIILHAHLQYVCNMSAKYGKEILKALGGVDFTKYAIPTIIVYLHLSKIGYVQNTVNLSKIIFSPL